MPDIQSATIPTATIENERAPAPSAAAQSWLPWLPYILLVVVITAIYYQVIGKLVMDWYDNPDFSHGFLVVPFAMFLLWDKRKVLRDTPIRQTWSGVWLLLAGHLRSVHGRLRGRALSLAPFAGHAARRHRLDALRTGHAARSCALRSSFCCWRFPFRPCSSTRSPSLCSCWPPGWRARCSHFSAFRFCAMATLFSSPPCSWRSPRLAAGFAP